MNSTTYSEYKSITVSMFSGLKEYFKIYWNILFLFVLLVVCTQFVIPAIAWMLAIYFWIITCDHINSLRESDRLDCESKIRNKEIQDQLEKVKSMTLDKYGELLKAKKYDELVEKLKEIK